MAKDMQTIKRASRGKQSPYYSINRKIMQNNKLSYEARGMLAYLLSMPDDWETRISNLQNEHAGRGKVYSIITELIQAGHIEGRQRTRNAKGMWEYTPYIIHEEPIEVKHEDTPDSSTNPRDEKPHTDEPHTESRHISTYKEDSTKNTLQDKPANEKPTTKSNAVKASNPPVAPPPLSADEFAQYEATLKDEFKLLDKSLRMKILQYLTGRLKADKRFSSNPVSLRDLRLFVVWYRAETKSGLSLPTSLDSLSNWFLKYREYQSKSQAMQVKRFAPMQASNTPNLGDGDRDELLDLLNDAKSKIGDTNE